MADLLASLGAAASPGDSSFSISIDGGGNAAASQDAFDAFVEGGVASGDATAVAESEAAPTKSLKKKKKKKKKKKDIASFEDEFGPDPEINRFMQMDGGDVEMQSVDKVYGQRWWILFFHSLLVFTASAVCYSYTAIMEETAKCWGIGEGWIALFPSMFFLAAVPMALAAGFTLQRRDLRFTVLLGAWLVAGGAAFRMLSSAHWTLALAGQAVSGSGAPLLLLSAEVMGALWFPVDERDLAVSIVQASAWLGAAFAFLAGPLLLRNRDDVMASSVLVVDTAVSFLAVAAAVGATLVFRSTPPSPPTVAAPTLAHDQVPFGHSWMDMLVPLVQGELVIVCMHLCYDAFCAKPAHNLMSTRRSPEHVF